MGGLWRVQRSEFRRVAHQGLQGLLSSSRAASMVGTFRCSVRSHSSFVVEERVTAFKRFRDSMELHAKVGRRDEISRDILGFGGWWSSSRLTMYTYNLFLNSFSLQLMSVSR